MWCPTTENPPPSQWFSFLTKVLHEIQFHCFYLKTPPQKILLQKRRLNWAQSRRGSPSCKAAPAPGTEHWVLSVNTGVGAVDAPSWEVFKSGWMVLWGNWASERSRNHRTISVGKDPLVASDGIIFFLAAGEVLCFRFSMSIRWTTEVFWLFAEQCLP